jgi:glycine dehydrogenase subunit 2
MNYGIDTGVFPLGSCTMKHNPRLNEKMARLPGFGDIHPLQPQSTVPGALALIAELSHWLCELTGMPAVALTPKAGAHGELCGMMAIKAALAARGEKRSIVLVPDSAHGTNPATAALLGYRVEAVPARPDGTVDPEEVKKHLSSKSPAIMLTNPNTCGLFERDVVAIADAVHAAGAYFYADGRELQRHRRQGAAGRSRSRCDAHQPAQDLLDAAWRRRTGCRARWCCRRRSRPFAPFLRGDRQGRRPAGRARQGRRRQAARRMCAFHGQMGMFVRAMSYMLAHGADGMRQASEDAVLNANYVKAGLADLMSLPFGDRPCMHEVLFDDHWLDGTGVSTLDFAKAMIDEGYHPMTMYFPLVVHGAMLIEPTESESKASLDLFVAALRDLAMAAKRGDTRAFSAAPYYAPRRRLDETRAARQPVLRWVRPAPQSEAAE